MYGIVTETKNIVSDNIKDSSGEPRKGILVFKKKSDAVYECEELNYTRQKMKLPQVYSVSKLSQEDLINMDIILDGEWKPYV